MLFTKTHIQNLINDSKDIIYLQTYMGFEDLGQGYGYKSYEAWESDNSDTIVYIPEYCYDEYENEEGTRITTLDICSCYTKQDFIKLAGEQSEDLFDSVDWQHPLSLYMEWDD